MSEETEPEINPHSRPIYVSNRGDLFEFLFDLKGHFVEVRVAPNGKSSAAYTLTYYEVPDEVRHDYENQYLDRVASGGRKHR